MIGLILVLLLAAATADPAGERLGVPSAPLSANAIKNASSEKRQQILDAMIASRVHRKGEQEEEDVSIDLHRGGGFLGKGDLSCLSCESDHCGEGDDDSTGVSVCSGAVKCYVGHVRNTDGEVTKSRGCARDRATASFYCRRRRYDGRNTHAQLGASTQLAFDCCDDGDLCNDGDFPPLPPVPVLGGEEEGGEGGAGRDGVSSSSGGSSSSSSQSVKIILVSVIPVVVLVPIVFFAVSCIRNRHRRRMCKLEKKALAEIGDAEGATHSFLRARDAGNSTMQDMLGGGVGAGGPGGGPCELTSGSGSGLTHLEERTLAKSITFLDREPLGKGRYGEVWRSLLRGDVVAVKIFNTVDERSWNREKEVYDVLRNPHILGYRGADVASRFGSTRMWLVTDYHRRGSLYDYLSRGEGAAVDPVDALRLLLSAAKGIDHLHYEMPTGSGRGKPGIAHRDVKSKNILVRDDLTCVIADFGLAVIHDKSDTLDIPEHKNRVGTKRYMSPEVLDLSINDRTTFGKFCESDMYSFALVVWEVLRKTRVELPTMEEEARHAHEPPAHALPYFGDVGPDPSFEEMKKVVCEDERRPPLYEKWKKNKITRVLSQKMSECWSRNPAARLSALNLKKAMIVLEEEEEAAGSTAATANLRPTTRRSLTTTPSSTTATTMTSGVSLLSSSGTTAATTPARRSGVHLGVAGVMEAGVRYHASAAGNSSNNSFSQDPLA